MPGSLLRASLLVMSSLDSHRHGEAKSGWLVLRGWRFCYFPWSEFMKSGATHRGRRVTGAQTSRALRACGQASTWFSKSTILADEAWSDQEMRSALGSQRLDEFAGFYIPRVLTRPKLMTRP